MKTLRLHTATQSNTICHYKPIIKSMKTINITTETKQIKIQFKNLNIMKTLKISLLIAALMLSGSLIAETSGKGEKVKNGAVGFMNKMTKNSHDRSVDKANKTLVKATKTLENILVTSDHRIPKSLLNEMEGIVIIPSAVKAALAWGGQGGRGIAMVRDENGEWSNPVFITLGEGSIGFQAGFEFSEIVLLFKDSDDIIKLEKAEITLGADAEIVAGPVCTKATAISDIKFDSKIISYSYGKGVFAGASVKGGVLKSNRHLNEAYYDTNDHDFNEIFFNTDTTDKVELNEFMNTLNECSM